MRYLVLISCILASSGCRVARYTYVDELAFRRARENGDIQALSYLKSRKTPKIFAGISLGTLAVSAPLWGGCAYHATRGHGNEAVIFGFFGFLFDIGALVTGILHFKYHYRCIRYRELFMSRYRSLSLPQREPSVYGHVVPDPLGGMILVKKSR